jgi:hypothetical protein
MRHGQKLIERVGFMKFWRIHHYFFAAKAALSQQAKNSGSNFKKWVKKF